LDSTIQNFRMFIEILEELLLTLKDKPKDKYFTKVCKSLLSKVRILNPKHLLKPILTSSQNLQE